MKRAFLVMLAILGVMVIICGLAVGGYFYVKSAAKPKTPHAPTPSELKALLVDLPENTTNTQDGLIQFTAHLLAANDKSKTAVTDILPMVQDAVNQAMRDFTDAQLKTADGQTKLEQDIENRVNHLLQGGMKITQVYFSTWIVQ
ncbi:hypothetical protein GCM10025857_03870 [Alicyclobacillus contaminans]|uniref:flagellar basal body-associated FliL family protein n=1 Tax=Alicyclobacillus contaminans TaxID=392016 RepID=UPI00040437D6|nr:flagellar basal body-associated FliL family protein [Alicyclobacillus contaminans]GMA49030.1 hypothetical protein GCM10025857_03870 [Alicyclobacillus contaminans]